MIARLAYSVDFQLIAPSCCNVPFLMSVSHYQARCNDHQTWWCPNCGASRYFPDKSDKEKLERRLLFEKNRREAAECEAEYQKNSARAQKAAKTRLKNRIKNGVCPCCNRTFANLQGHIKTKHPEYVNDKKTN